MWVFFDNAEIKEDVFSYWDKDRNRKWQYGRQNRKYIYLSQETWQIGIPTAHLRYLSKASSKEAVPRLLVVSYTMVPWYHDSQNRNPISIDFYELYTPLWFTLRLCLTVLRVISCRPMLLRTVELLMKLHLTVYEIYAIRDHPSP